MSLRSVIRPHILDRPFPKLSNRSMVAKAAAKSWLDSPAGGYGVHRPNDPQHPKGPSVAPVQRLRVRFCASDVDQLDFREQGLPELPSGHLRGLLRPTLGTDISFGRIVHKARIDNSC